MFPEVLVPCSGRCECCKPCTDHSNLLPLQAWLVGVPVWKQKFPAELFPARKGSAARLLQMPQCTLPRLPGARLRGPGHSLGTGRDTQGWPQSVLPLVCSLQRAQPRGRSRSKDTWLLQCAAAGQETTGVHEQMDVPAVLHWHTSSKEMKQSLLRIYPWQALLLYPQLHRKMQSPQNRPEQSRENGLSTPSGTHSLISGSKIMFIQGTVNFGKVLPMWAKKTDYINTEKSDVGKKLWCSRCGKVLCGGAQSASLLNADMHMGRSLHLQVNVQKTPTHT